MPTIDITNEVKKQLEEYKEHSGCKTYSDAVNYLLMQNELLTQMYATIKENNELLKEQRRSSTIWKEYIQKEAQIWEKHEKEKKNEQKE